MDIKLIELIKVREILTKLSKNKFPVKVSYEIAKFLRYTDVEAELYSEQLNSILEEYKDSSAAAGTFQILPEKIDACNKELSVLENHIVNIEPLHINVEAIESVEITPEEIYWLFPIIQ